MKKNLVLGGDGFVGKPLCEYLRSIGQEATSYDIKSGNDASYGTIGIANYDCVYFLAWDVGGSKFLGSRDAQFDQLEHNLPLMMNVFQELEITKVPFVFVSSRLAEDVDSVYGVTKRLGEVWTRLLPNGRIVRLWNVYGAYEEVSERSHVVADFIHEYLDTGTIREREPTEPREYVYIDKVCKDIVYTSNIGKPLICESRTNDPVSLAVVRELVLSEEGNFKEIIDLFRKERANK
jgi:nucleoside-diphosphate-sugar epimerase